MAFGMIKAVLAVKKKKISKVSFLASLLHTLTKKTTIQNFCLYECFWYLRTRSLASEHCRAGHTQNTRAAGICKGAPVFFCLESDVHIYIYTIHTHTHTRTHAHTHTHIIYMYTHTQIHIYIYIHIHSLLTKFVNMVHYSYFTTTLLVYTKVIVYIYTTLLPQY